MVGRMTDRKTGALTIKPGQTWREWGNFVFAREIVSVSRQPDGSMQVKWRRPNGMWSRGCDIRRFRRWIADTQATP